MQTVDPARHEQPLAAACSHDKGLKSAGQRKTGLFDLDAKRHSIAGKDRAEGIGLILGNNPGSPSQRHREHKRSEPD